MQKGAETIVGKKRHWPLVSSVAGVLALGVLLAGPAVGQQTNQQPIPDIVADPISGAAGTFIFLDGTASSDPDGTIVSFSWDFGDGTPEVTGDIVQAGQVYHSYASDGVYAVTLTVTDNLGAGSDPTTAGATVTIIIGSGTTTTTTTTQPPGGGGSTPSGSAVYASSCAACHGASGQGGLGPSLQTSTFGTGATISAVANGVGTMPGYSSQLTQAEIDAVSAYSVRFQSRGPTDTTEEPASTDTTVTGSVEELYASGCAACHGVSGEGAFGPSLQVSTFGLAATVNAIANGVGTMPGDASGLSAEQIDALAAYSVAFQTGEATEVDVGTTDETDPTGPVGDASGLPTGEGADLYASTCAACHGALGEGGVGGPVNMPFDNDQLVEIIRVGIGDMPGFGEALDDSQITLVAEYVHALGAQTAPTDPPASDNEHLVAIQPSRYVELDAARTSVPVDSDVLLRFALASMAVLGLLAYWEIRRTRKIHADTTKSGVV